MVFTWQVNKTASNVFIKLGGQEVLWKVGMISTIHSESIFAFFAWSESCRAQPSWSSDNPVFPFHRTGRWNQSHTEHRTGRWNQSHAEHSHLDLQTIRFFLFQITERWKTKAAWTVLFWEATSEQELQEKRHTSLQSSYERQRQTCWTKCFLCSITRTNLLHYVDVRSNITTIESVKLPLVVVQNRVRKTLDDKGLRRAVCAFICRTEDPNCISEQGLSIFFLYIELDFIEIFLKSFHPVAFEVTGSARIVCSSALSMRIANGAISAQNDSYPGLSEEWPN